MDDSDKKDIINKVENSGNSDNSSDNSSDNNTDNSSDNNTDNDSHDDSDDDFDFDGEMDEDIVIDEVEWDNEYRHSDMKRQDFWDKYAELSKKYNDFEDSDSGMIDVPIDMDQEELDTLNYLEDYTNNIENEGENLSNSKNNHIFDENEDAMLDDLINTEFGEPTEAPVETPVETPVEEPKVDEPTPVRRVDKPWRTPGIENDPDPKANI